MSEPDANRPNAPEDAFRLFQSLTAESQARQTLTSLARLAAWVAEAPMAAVVAALPDRIETLAAHGVANGSLATPFDFKAAGYSPRELFASPDARKHPFLAKQKVVRQGPKLRALLRFPVHSEHLPFVVGLGVADTRPREEANWPSARAREMLFEIAGIAEAEIAVAADIVRMNGGDAEPAPSVQELTAAVTRSAEPAMLLDTHLRVIRANAAMAALIGVSREAVDRVLTDFPVPGAQTLARLARWSLERSERISDIAFDLRPDETARSLRSASISLDPLAARDSADKYLLVRARDVSPSLAGAVKLETLIAPPQSPPEPTEADATADFLLQTLVERACVRSRRAMSFITLRAWRGAIKAYQIKALRALTPAPPPALVDTIAAEMQQAVDLMIGRGAFAGVVPLPCGHPAGQPCLSQRIAERLAERLGLPCLPALQSDLRAGSSQPIDNTRRPPIRLAQDPKRPVLLVDDIATTGRHLEEAVTLLRPGCGAVFALAWIGGEAGE